MGNCPYRDVSCNKDHCQVWDSDNQRCGTMVSDLISEMQYYLLRVLGKATELDNGHSLIAYLKDVVGHSDEMVQLPGDIHGLLSPSILSSLLHADLEHNNCSMSKANYLFSEYMTNQDLDNGAGVGGSVYGKDFMIKEDYDCPELLKSTHGHPNWTDPDVEITWPEYLASCGKGVLK